MQRVNELNEEDQIYYDQSQMDDPDGTQPFKTGVYEEYDDGFNALVAELEEKLHGKINKLNITLPRKPLSPYLRFIIEQQGLMRNKFKNQTQKQIQDNLKHQWENTSELKKAQYHQAYENEKQQYEILKDEFNIITKPPKKPASGYIIFFQEERKKMLEENPDKMFSAMTLEVSEKWKSLDREIKNKYELQNYQNKMKYEQDIQKYEQRKNDQQIIERYVKNKEAYEVMLKQVTESYKQVVKKEDLKNTQIRQANQILTTTPAKEIENIIGYKTIKGSKHYLIKWVGQGNQNATWERRDNLKEFEDIIQLFEDEYIHPENTQTKVEQIQPEQSRKLKSTEPKQVKVKQSKVTPDKAIEQTQTRSQAKEKTQAIQETVSQKKNAKIQKKLEQTQEKYLPIQESQGKLKQKTAKSQNQPDQVEQTLKIAKILLISNRKSSRLQKQFPSEEMEDLKKKYVKVEFQEPVQQTQKRKSTMKETVQVVKQEIAKQKIKREVSPIEKIVVEKKQQKSDEKDVENVLKQKKKQQLKPKVAEEDVVKSTLKIQIQKPQEQKSKSEKTKHNTPAIQVILKEDQKIQRTLKNQVKHNLMKVKKSPKKVLKLKLLKQEKIESVRTRSHKDTQSKGTQQNQKKEVLIDKKILKRRITRSMI